MSIKKIIEQNGLFTRVIGYVVFIIVNAARMKNLFRKKGRGVVVLCFHKLGDSVFTIPALREIFNQYKEPLYIFCFSETKSIYELVFESRHIIVFNHSDFLLSNRIARSLIRKKLSEINPEIIFDLTGTVTSASILFNAGARVIAGINEEFYRSIYNHYVPIRKEPHIIDIYLDAISPLVKIHDRTAIKELSENMSSGDYILIHPYAGWSAKEWGVAKFIQLALSLAEEHKVKIVAEKGRENNEFRTALNGTKIEFIETADIDDLVKVTRGCSLFISNDSGPLYIANTLGKPTFTIYGPTNPDYHLPYGDKHDYIQKIIQCSPAPGNKLCFTNGGREGCPSYECMNLLSVHEVYSKVKQFIQSDPVKDLIQTKVK